MRFSIVSLLSLLHEEMNFDFEGKESDVVGCQSRGGTSSHRVVRQTKLLGILPGSGSADGKSVPQDLVYLWLHGRSLDSLARLYLSSPFARKRVVPDDSERQTTLVGVRTSDFVCFRLATALRRKGSSGRKGEERDQLRFL